MGPWPTDLAGLDDNAVIERARHLYRELQRTPRWHDSNDALIRSWGEICRELGRRGIADTVTEGETPADRFTRLMTGQGD